METDSAENRTVVTKILKYLETPEILTDGQSVEGNDVSTDRKALTRSRLISTAEELLIEQGFDGMSVESITNKMGVAKGTFFYHFESKNDLIDEIVAANLDEISRRVEGIAGDEDMSAIVKLNRIFQYFWEIAFEKKELWSCLYADGNVLLHARFDDGLAQMFVPNFMTIIDQGVSEGVFDVPDTFAAALSVLGTTFFTPREKLRGYDLSDPGKDYVRLNCQLLERILGVEEGGLRECLVQGVVLEDDGRGDAD